MASKPEATYRNSVHKHLSKSVYHASVGGAYVAGVPDVYYEGNAGVIWIEWKYFQKLPKSIWLPNPSGTAKLSALQAQWLKRAASNSVATAVICGSPEGGVIYQGLDWNESLSQDEFIQRAKPRKEIAAWIQQQVLGSP